MTTTRREALYTIGMAAASTALCGCTRSGSDDPGVPTGIAEMCGDNACLRISDNPELELVGGIVFVSVGNKQLFIQRVSDTELTALSASCTHAACTVVFNGNDRFDCPCHGSSFDAATGAVLRAPANRPLDDFEVVLAGDDVTIML
jgi:Rieske Fe-S protein